MNKEDSHYDKCLAELFTLLPKDQIDKVFRQYMCDIDATFIGFINVYKNLSEIIPKHFTIIDFGCAYNPQCFFFKDHHKYIAVDNSDLLKFKSDNCQFYYDNINSFIKEHGQEFNVKETFAICSYVPADTKIIRETFPNVFVYYPHGSNSFKK